MSAPRATARLQLHAGYTLDDACAQAPYYAALGISHLYLSPISQARSGSTHGYDVIDHQRINPELGGEAALRRLSDTARRHSLGLIADIVPNHMAAHASNAWWADVLRHGAQSRHARTFDIDWQPADTALHGKVLLPVLGEPYGESLAAGHIRLIHDSAAGAGYAIEAGGQHLPLAPGTAPAGDAPDAVCAAFDPAVAGGAARLHALLERQHYRLAWWRTAPEQINWRRFFEISELVGVRVEDDAVFDAVHALPLQLVREGVLDGLRIDHVDGLASPGAYLRRLRQQLDDARARNTGGAAYLVVEKILAEDETLDARWPVDGTTGYDFMDQAGALLHAPNAQAPLEQFWNTLSGDARSASAQLLDARHRMLARHFPVERQGLVRALTHIAQQDLRTRDWTPTAIDRVLTALLAAFPVYRSYAEDGGRSVEDKRWCRLALDRAREALGASESDIRLLEQIDAWLAGPQLAGADDQSPALRRFQQLTPPLAAKALEDTLFYRRGPLLSRNEVGSSPTQFALPLAAFHALTRARARSHPHAMLATATHDHKRGEDTRARLAVLSEMPERWRRAAENWIPRLGTAGTPTPADRYLLLQSLVGAWPLTLSVEHAGDVAAFLERILQWQEKALREAKLHTSWTDPNAGYEAAGRLCVTALQDTDKGQALLRDIAAWTAGIAPAGLVNSLTQTLLRNTLPGVPDLYQGTDLWDFSLVDPDNRRPVDYAARAALLAAGVAGAAHAGAARAGAASGSPIATDSSAWRSGAIKLQLIQRCLALRALDPGLFDHGDYLPLSAQGPQAGHVIAYLRRHEGRAVLIVAPHHCALALAPYAQDQAAQAARFWDGTLVHLPEGVGTLCNVLSGQPVCIDATGRIPLADLLRDCPVALCAPC
ncbi:malto-oligosyltrehalose synthase [Achromobacter kerstersii]|uniref:malto-oligosyltrehalose synthase n=1 Tax=Achromobacter kerstersii TaxID=1353890 RepID=UPI003D058B92